MFKIESYITPILLSYVDKYVRDFKPADAQVSLWGGGVALHNLVLKPDVLQQEVALPFTLVSGRIHELLIQVPWTKIMSEPIIVTIDTIECILSLTPPTPTDEGPPPESPSRKTQSLEAPPGYMQALVRRIVSNIAVRVHHLIVKYVQDDIVLSLNVKHLAVDSASSKWEPAFADIDPSEPLIRRLVNLDDLTLCLDRADADGKIRFYQEPLLYRCQLDLRVLTRLVSANTRRLSSLSIQILSTKLAWGVSADQLTLLLRLVRERPAFPKPPTPSPPSNTALGSPIHANNSNTAEPTRSESWSEWAWSWLPTWSDREGGFEEAPVVPSATPFYFNAFLDEVSLTFKIMETDTGRKRARPVLEMTANHAAVKTYVCAPITTRVRIAAQTLTFFSMGKCVCGFLDFNAFHEEPTIYLSRVPSEETKKEPWEWPKDQINNEIEKVPAINEMCRSAPDIETTDDQKDDPGIPEQPGAEPKAPKDDEDDFWVKMSPQLYIEYNHERTPPEAYVNPFENPPTDFQYSDWAEENSVKVTVKPMEIRVCMGLLHRIKALLDILHELTPIPKPEISMRVLTVEECEALADNLPQRCMYIEANDLRIRFIPWDHSEKASTVPLVFDIDLPKNAIYLNGPLYPHRVCSAACQMPEDSGPLWQGARLHITLNMSSVSASICAPAIKMQKICARADIRAVGHLLQNKDYFIKRESVVFGYSLKINEANICGSLARLQAAYEILFSLLRQRMSSLLKNSTLALDAINDENAVMLDLTFEDLVLRGYQTRNIITHILILQSAKAMNMQELKRGDVKQAFLFSAPDSPRSASCLRAAFQWCLEPLSYSMDYLGAWSEPTAIAVDPLFIAWLMYSPVIKSYESVSLLPISKLASSTHFVKRRVTPPSSSGRGASKSGGSATELVHMRPRSLGSSGKEGLAKPNIEQAKEPNNYWWSGDRLLEIHERLRRMYVNIELGLTLVYVTLTTASAIDCVTIRDTMERHASCSQCVLTLSLGRLLAFSSTIKKQFWNEINHEGPTFIQRVEGAPLPESFPWKMRLADVSCYTLEVTSGTDRYGRDRAASGLRSQLRTALVATPRTILELVATTVTLSVVTKSVHYKILPKVEKVKVETPSAKEQRTKYFKGGLNFKPTTLKEFIRGPAKRRKSGDDTENQKPDAAPEPEVSTGPVISLGVNLHADTPPLVFRLDQDQVHVIVAAAHSISHIIDLLQRQPLRRSTGYSGSARNVARSTSLDDGLRTPSEDTLSENKSADIVSIFEARSLLDTQNFEMKTFFWFQWVISRVTLVVATTQVKLAFEIDDIISTIDVQAHYNQLKVKLASASIKYYQKCGSDDWVAGVLGGRILEAREPTNAKEENHFLSVTITQARISNLPASWREEMDPKLFEEKNAIDSMWEIFASLAPLEVVLQPVVLSHIERVIREMAPRTSCPFHKTPTKRVSTWQWPLCYVSAGGLRLVVTRERESATKDDSFVLSVGTAMVNPNPENPIYRQAVGSSTEVSWQSSNSGVGGRQYELTVQKVSLRTARFGEIVKQETSDTGLINGTGGENPAVKWTQKVVMPNFTPVLHSVDVGCVLAPALYTNGVLTSGPAIDLNLLTDCAVEISIEQLGLAYGIFIDISNALDVDDAECLLYDETHGKCPLSSFIMPKSLISELETLATVDEAVKVDTSKLTNEALSSTADSGVETVTSYASQSFRVQEEGVQSVQGAKKTVSVAFNDTLLDPFEYLEVFVTMGNVELSLYTVDDDSEEINTLRLPADEKPKTDQSEIETPVETAKSEGKIVEQLDDLQTNAGSKSLTETIRHDDLERNKIELPVLNKLARRNEGNVPLFHIILYQPNLYYWRNKNATSIQVSLFNAWVGLGLGNTGDMWNRPLLKTAKGVIDPVTEIPPALATMKIIIPRASTSGTITKGTVRLDVERPVMFEVSVDRVQRLLALYKLIKSKFRIPFKIRRPIHHEQIPVLYKVKKMFVQNTIESVTVQMTQVGVCGIEGAAGWDSATLQLAAGGRPEKISMKASFSAFTVSAGPPTDARHVLMQPLMAGIDMEATWEMWCRAEGGTAAKEPTVRTSFEFDYIMLDLRPEDFVTLMETIDELKPVVANYLASTQETEYYDDSDESLLSTTEYPPSATMNVSFEKRLSTESADSNEEHYYKDDLRSGAFKIVSGGQLPMAYQITLYKDIVSWRYPHPRAITRLVIFPLPGHDKETPCVLELYNPLLHQWAKHTIFKIPVSSPVEMLLYVLPPGAVFGVMWRYRVCSETDDANPPFEFNISRFQPKANPLANEYLPEPCITKSKSTVTAEELSGVVRVDSCFSPKAVPRVTFITRVANFAIHLHNTQPSMSSQATTFEGYYVSKPLMRNHRVLRLAARDASGHAQLASAVGSLLLFNSRISSDIMECATGTMQQIVEEFHMKGGVSMPLNAEARARLSLSRVYVSLHVPRLRTIHSLARDWESAVQPYTRKQSGSKNEDVDASQKTTKTGDVQAALEGRISMWVHNTCAFSIRVGQEGTDEVVPLGPGVSLAYRWRSPTAKKKLRFALAGPDTNWQWSSSIPFTCDTYRIRLYNVGMPGQETNGPGRGLYIHTKVEEIGSRRMMTLSGRLALANMLRFNLLFKVRARCSDSNQWQTVCSGELSSESMGNSVVCEADCEMALKIKFTAHESGWSGDIPLKECPKENVPWLVKVPSEGESPYMSVWCRVVRASSDARVLATIWPLYVLYSYLPLETDVLIVTESVVSSNDLNTVPPPLIQTAPGRGSSTHLLAPGTTAARHTLSFQYREIECPVTREAVPLHYGVTDVSVFDKRTPVNSVDDVVLEITKWLKRSSRHAQSAWPFSLVAQHWPGTWQPAMIQPKSDVNVRYRPVRAGGGCSLEVQLCPVVLLCNSAPIALTLRAHDAAPLCRLEPGTVISPPSTILQKPFFISVELGRETFVSSELAVYETNLGRYGEPPPGKVAVDRFTHLAIYCNHKVALLSMHYEIKEGINLLGLTPTYMLLNRMKTGISVSAIAIANESKEQIRPTAYTVVEPIKEGSIHGTPLCRFGVQGRWCGSEPQELSLFVCITLTSHTPNSMTLPIQVGQFPYRRAISLLDSNNASVAVVVSQVKHEGRWLISVAPDPCPQFIVHNKTASPLGIAQPLKDSQEPSTSKVMIESECAGSSWYNVVEAGAIRHYSTPAHSRRYPPDENVPAYRHSLVFLTFCKVHENDHPLWCEPVGVTDGEQLVQLFSGDTVKLRVRTHPHSTHLEIRDVDENDISASDIRNRLFGAFASNSTKIPVDDDEEKILDSNLERVGADSKLLNPSESPLTSQSGVKTDTSSKADTSTKADISSKNELTLDQQSTSVTKKVTITPVTQVIEPQPTQSLVEQTAVTFNDVQPAVTLNDKQNPVTLTVEPTPDPNQTADQSAVDQSIRKDVAEDMKGINEDLSALPLPILGRSRSKSPITLELFNDMDIDYTPTDSNKMLKIDSFDSTYETNVFKEVTDPEWEESCSWSSCDRLRTIASAIVVDIAAASDERPLFALYLDRAAFLVRSDVRKTKITISIGDMQVDNLQYENGQYDFGVVATTRSAGATDTIGADTSPLLWNIFVDSEAFAPRLRGSRAVIRLIYDSWSVLPQKNYTELTEVEIRGGPISVYVEDAYVTAVAKLWQRAMPRKLHLNAAILEEGAIRTPLRLRSLHIHPLDLTLTLHTAVRMYIALDQSPLRLNSFKLQDAMTSTERLTHALTVHYLSAAILGAGWVVGGLELLGAPGALAARVGGARGGVRGVASATAAALVRSLSACAGSLARNLDLLAGDEEHSKRAAAARRRPPPSLMAGIAAGVTNFAINILGAVGGLAHHPFVGVAVGETDSGTTALRRSLIGALAKPLSATADLVAYAGHGLLTQTGWDPVPQPRTSRSGGFEVSSGWRRDCVRWTFRLAELSAISGFHVLLDTAALHLLLTHRFLVVADPESERIVEMIDFRYCTIGPYQGQIIELQVTQRRPSLKTVDVRIDEDDEIKVSAAAMARVARYTGTEGGAQGMGETRVLSLLPSPGYAHALHAALTAAIHHNNESHFAML